MHFSRFHLAGACLLLLFVASTHAFMHASPNTPRSSTASVGCTQCGLGLQFCPSNVGCGLSDPTSITCYCKDWSWCSDSSDCSVPAPSEEVPSADSILPVVLRACNRSDFRQWILVMDPVCSNYQELVFAPRDENNDIFLLTESTKAIAGYNVFGAYVNSYTFSSLRTFQSI